MLVASTHTDLQPDVRVRVQDTRKCEDCGKRSIYDCNGRAACGPCAATWQRIVKRLRGEPCA